MHGSVALGNTQQLYHMCMYMWRVIEAAQRAAGRKEAVMERELAAQQEESGSGVIVGTSAQAVYGGLGGGDCGGDGACHGKG